MFVELEKLTIRHNEDLRSALKVINENAQGLCFVLDEKKVIGVLTDGDLRRALINDFELTHSVSEVMQKDFKWLPYSATTSEIQATLSEHIKYLPLLNSDFELVDFACAHHYHHIPNNLFLTFLHLYNPLLSMVEGVGFEPTKAKPADLQSAPVDRLGTPPRT